MDQACQTSRKWIGRVSSRCWPWAASLLVLAIVGRPAAGSDAQAVDSYRKDVQPILSKYCFDCHADGANKGNVSFDTFKSDDELVTKRELWYAVLKNTRANIMPPAKRSRPTTEEQKVLERWIKTSAFGLDPKDPDPGRVTLRRLNRIEYRNTIRDLLGADYDTDKEFPPDDIGYGFDNIGDVLSFSPLLAEKYIAAAKNIVGAAVPTIGKVLPVREIAGEPKKNTLSFTTGGKLDYAFQVDKAGDYHVVLEAVIRGSFDFDTSRAQLVCKLDDQEKLKEEHGWQNSKKLRFEFKGHWQPGEQHRFELELTKLPAAKEGVGKKNATTNLQGISVKVEGPLDPNDWPYQKNYERIFFRGAACR